METDKIRLIATYLIATLVLAGCFVLLMVPSQVDAKELLPFLTGVVGLVLGWLFQKEGTAAAQRSTERAVSLGAQSAQAPQS